jgi:mRNA interferase HigB
VEIIGRLKLQSFWRSHRQARKPFEKWIQVVEEAEWGNWTQLKSTFGRADLVRTKANTYVVFDIGGNKYRLITTVNFRGQIVIVEVALTHREYDKGKWKG